MTDRTALLDAIDRARDEAICRAFHALVETVAGGGEPWFRQTLRTIQDAHKGACEAVEKLEAAA